MHYKIKHQPNKTESWFVPFTLAIGILGLIGVGYFASVKKPELFFISLFSGAFGLCLTKMLYDSSNIILLFENEGIRIIGRKYSDYRYLPWNEYLHAYYGRALKGHLFLVLSSKELNPIDAKKYINKRNYSSKLYFDDVVVLHIDDYLQNIKPIKCFIADHVSYVKDI